MSDYISECILILIFKYLPVNSLLRFRCVCKMWKELIDSPTLLHEHLSVQKPRFLVEYEEQDEFLVVDPRTRLPLVDTLRRLDGFGTELVSIFGTLHGVVCLCDWEMELLIWNPSIRKSFTLTLPDDFQWNYSNCMRNCYGFWIDPSNKEFKIIILQLRPVANCILYSSIRRDWSVIPSGRVQNWKGCQESPPVMIGGVAHWRGCYDEPTFLDYWRHEHKDNSILSFDFVQESFDLIEMPDLEYFKSALCHWQGTLSLVCWNGQSPCRCNIYLRKDDSWVKMFGFPIYKPIEYAFWVMEDVEERVGDLVGEKQENVRVLATIKSDSSPMTGEVVLDGTKTGCIPIRRGLMLYDKVYIAYDFVESLLFP